MFARLLNGVFMHECNQELKGICHCAECQERPRLNDHLVLAKTWLGQFHFILILFPRGCPMQTHAEDFPCSQ